MARHELLFSSGDLDGTLGNLTRKALKTISSLSASQVDSHHKETLLQRLEHQFVVNPIRLHRERMTCDGPREVDIQLDADRALHYNYAGPVTLRGIEVTFIVPFDGDPWLFKCQPSSWTTVYPEGEIRGQEYRLTLQDPEKKSDRVKENREWQLRHVEDYVRRQESQINAYNQKITGILKGAIDQRRRELLANADFAQALELPDRTTVSPAKPEPSAPTPREVKDAKARASSQKEQHLLQEAADDGYIPAMFDYAMGLDDLDEKKKYLKLAADNGYIPAKQEYALLTNDSSSMAAPAIRPSVFICHAKQDSAAAEEIFRQLDEAGADPWLDKEKLVLGDDWEQEIKRAVASADAFVVCLRPGFHDIGFRQQEVHWAIEALQRRPPGRGFIIPFIVEPCDLPDWCKPFHAGSELSTRSTIEALIRAVEKHCNWTRRK